MISGLASLVVGVGAMIGILFGIFLHRHFNIRRNLGGYQLIEKLSSEHGSFHEIDSTVTNLLK
jgi:hypothetical protein